MIKKIFFIGLIASFILLVTFSRPLFQYISELAINFYTVKYLGESLHYEKAYWEGRKLIICKPVLQHKHAFSAECITLSYEIKPFARQLNLSLAFDQPLWEMEPAQLKAQQWQTVLSREEPWIKVNTALKIKEGIVKWEISEGIKGTAYVNLEGNSWSGGYIQASFDQPINSLNSFRLQASSQSEGILMDWHCQQLQCDKLLEFLTLLYPKLETWKVASGAIDGHLKLIFSKEKRPYLEGDLTLDHLQFKQITKQIDGTIEQARLHVAKNSRSLEGRSKTFTTIGELAFLKPASLTCSQNDQLCWRIENIVGSIHLDESNMAIVHFNAQGATKEHSSQFSLQGETNVHPQKSLGLALNLLCASSNQPEGEIQLLIHQPLPSQTIAEVDCKALSHLECRFVQQVLSSFWPAVQKVQFQEGAVNGCFYAELTKDGFHHLKFKELQAKKIQFQVVPWNMHFKMDQLTGNGSINLLADDIRRSLDAEIHVQNGQMTLPGGVNSRFYPLTDIYTDLLIDKGVVHHSLVKLQLGGLKGTMDIAWGGDKELIAAKLEGQAHDLAEILPTKLHHGIQSHFKDNQVGITAHMRRREDKLVMEGVMQVMNPPQDKIDLIHFGCYFKKDPKKGIGFPTGWFYAKKLPLEKFVAPFIIENRFTHLTGLLEVKGSFDANQLILRYQAEPITIENERVLIDLKMEASSSNSLPGFHRIDLKTYAHEGTLPIQQGTYTDKLIGLAFQSIQGQAFFNERLLQIKPVEAYCDGIYLNGQLAVDYQDPLPNSFKLKLTLPQVVGKISQLQTLLARFGQNNDLVNKIALEGDIEARDQGLVLAFDFKPDDYKMKARFQGALGNGTLVFAPIDKTIQELYANFTYDHEEQELRFEDIQGVILVGKSPKIEELNLFGNKLFLKGPKWQKIELDFSLWEKGHSLLRMAGHTQPQTERRTTFVMDKQLSHLAQVHPSLFEWTFNTEGETEFFKFAAHFPLQTIWKDFEYLMAIGLPNNSALLKEIQAIQRAEGNGSAHLHYEKRHNRFKFIFEGQNIKLNEKDFQTALLQGSKQDDTWFIDRLQLDQLILSAELQKWQDLWKVRFLGLEYGKALLLGLEGDLITKADKPYLDAKVNFFEADLGHLGQKEPFHKVMAKWRPKGYLKGTGHVKVNFLSQAPWLDIDAHLKVNTQMLSLRECPFRLTNPVAIDVYSNQKIELKPLMIGLVETSTDTCFNIDSLHFDCTSDHLTCPKMTFAIPASILEEVGNKLHGHFPDVFDKRFHKILTKLKKDGVLKGSLSIDKMKSHEQIHLTLEDGPYTFKKRNYQLQNFQLSVQGDQLQFSGLSQQERCLFHLQGKSAWPKCEKGELILRDLTSQAYGTLPPLKINWQDHPEEGLFIQSMYGYFSGIEFSLKRASAEGNLAPWAALQGSMDINFSQLGPLLSQDIQDKIEQLELGPSYALQGTWWVNLDTHLPLIDSLYFQGQFKGNDAILKGYQFEKMEADLQYSPSYLFIPHFNIEDKSMHASFKDVKIVKGEKSKQWMISFPHLIITEFKPSLLKEWGQSKPSKFKTLLIKRLSLDNFFGTFNDISTWQATGSLHFLNPSRKNLHHPLLAIPAEIILRLGLDPHVLNPVTGNIFFALRGDRFYLTRFKDVYSEGRGSKFYLAHEETPSWMDLKGNVFIQIRMKQYNLIFKLAELFTVTMQGNIKKPRYTLKKQGKSSKHLSILEQYKR